MRRLLYIILICILTVSAIVARDSFLSNDYNPFIFGETLFPDDEDISDSIEITETEDTVVTADSLEVQDSRRTRASYRRPYINPVNNASTRTQYINDAQGDSARMLERKKSRSIHYHDDQGRTIMIDTITGEEWMDSTLIPPPPKMKYPLLYAAEFGVNIWDPVMRIFGQKYGIIDFSASLNLHNRYIPTIEIGLGTAKKTPSGMNFTYQSPIAPYFKIGADYNFIYNSDPDYRFVAGLRYGFSAFRYNLTNVSFDDNYWGESGTIDFPSQNVTAGWFEIVAGLRVKIWGPISAGWMFRYHSLLHQTKPSTGEAWYIPGFGSSSTTITGSFSIYYTLPLGKDKHNNLGPATDVGSNGDAFEIKTEPVGSGYILKPEDNDEGLQTTVNE